MRYLSQSVNSNDVISWPLIFTDFQSKEHLSRPSVRFTRLTEPQRDCLYSLYHYLLCELKWRLKSAKFHTRMQKGALQYANQISACGKSINQNGPNASFTLSFTKS